ncbi:hypothetical protein [Streptomyces sp. NPDC002463]|uniref:hypothetical protein n=1 Tax=Streptomyces sp. NPDC002463 TaxID=3364645 RepID=UPI00367F9191
MRPGPASPWSSRTRRSSRATGHSRGLSTLAYAIHDSFGLRRARVRAPAPRAEGLAPAGHAAHRPAFDPTGDEARRVEAVADRARTKCGPKAVLPGSPAA